MAATNDVSLIKKETKVYLMVFAGLLGLTVITVAVSYLHLPLKEAVILALLIACVKASLVACYFMHLISERMFVYLVLGFTLFFFVALMGLSVYEYHDVVEGAVYVS